jgi:hypothetical protein
MDPEPLAARLHRRNWWILATMAGGSLLFGNWPVTTGIIAGGLVAIGGFSWLQRSLKRLLTEPVQGAGARYQLGYVVRLLALAAVLALLVAVIKIHPVGLAIGLSVVVINLLWLMFQSALK